MWWARVSLVPGKQHRVAMGTAALSIMGYRVYLMSMVSLWQTVDQVSPFYSFPVMFYSRPSLPFLYFCLLIYIRIFICLAADLNFSVRPSLSLNKIVLPLLSLPRYQTINMSAFILCLYNFSPSLLLFPCQEKRRLQEEQDRARREMEDEKLRLQQLKVWHTYTGWSNLSHSFTHMLTHTHTALISLICNPLRTHSSLLASR